MPPPVKPAAISLSFRAEVDDLLVMEWWADFHDFPLRTILRAAFADVARQVREEYDVQLNWSNVPPSRMSEAIRRQVERVAPTASPPTVTPAD